MGPYAPLVPVSLMLLAYCLRRFSPAGGWLHTLGGATFIAFCSGLLGAIAEAIAAHGISANVIVPAVCSFFMSFIATGNPSKKMEETPKGDVPGASARALLPLLLLPALLTSGCQTAGGQALKRCELDALPAAMQSVEAAVLSIAMDPSSWVDDLVTLAYKLGKDQVNCAAQAIAAWLDKTPAPSTLASDVRAFASGPPTDSPARAHAKKVLRDYLDQHPAATSCRPVKVALLDPCADEQACRPVVIEWGQMPELRR